MHDCIRTGARNALLVQFRIGNQTKAQSVVESHDHFDVDIKLFFRKDLHVTTAVHFFYERTDLFIASRQDQTETFVFRRLFVEFDFDARPSQSQLPSKRAEELLAPLFNRRPTVDNLIDFSGQTINLALGNLIDNGLFVVKIVVEIAHAHARAFGNLMHRRRLEAALVKTLSGSQQNLLAQTVGCRTECRPRHFASAVCVAAASDASS